MTHGDKGHLEIEDHGSVLIVRVDGGPHGLFGLDIANQLIQRATIQTLGDESKKASSANFREFHFQRLSGKSLGGSNGAFFGRPKRQKGAISHRSAGSRSYELEPVRSFQTVSGRGILRTSR